MRIKTISDGYAAENFDDNLVKTVSEFFFRSYTVIIFLFVFCVFWQASSYASPAAFGSKPPGWLRELANVSLPEFPPETEAVYLVYEQQLSVAENGIMRRSGRQAIRILRPDGIRRSNFLVRANTFQTRVIKMNGWVVNPDGSKHGLDIKSAVSTSLAPDTLYWDVKTLFLVLPQAVRGSLVGFEWEEEINPISLEDVFVFQHRFPVLEARYRLALPDGFRPLLSWVNWPEMPADFSARILEVKPKNIPAIKDEPLRPADEALAGRLLVRLRPEFRQPKFGQLFADWKDMGLWYDQLCRERRQPDESIRLKASQLVSGLTELREKVAKLAAFVQQEIRYVSIQIGIGGYQPHPAPEILVNRYGDCKDKATLLAALLSCLDLDSYYLIVNIERQAVTEKSPVSLFWFNHVILGIRLPDDEVFAGAEAVVSVPGLGRLLIFDPTMPHTSFGRLPFYLKKNYGLLVAGEHSQFLQLPGSDPEHHDLIRQGKFVLSVEGSLKGNVSEIISGFQAEMARLRLRDVHERERRKEMEGFLAKSVGPFTLERYEFQYLNEPEKDVELLYAFRAGFYLNRTGNILSFRPCILALFEDYEIFEQKGNRQYPVLLSGVGTSQDMFEITLPAGYAIDVLPEPVELSNGFADYSCHFELRGETLLVKRQLRLKDDFLAPSRFEEALEIFKAVASEERRRLVLRKISQQD